MITLHAVALLICLGDSCRAEVLRRETYDTAQDCDDRAQHLMQINPGKEFICIDVLRKEDGLRTGRFDTGTDHGLTDGADHLVF